MSPLSGLFLYRKLGPVSGIKFFPNWLKKFPIDLEHSQLAEKSQFKRLIFPILLKIALFFFSKMVLFFSKSHNFFPISPNFIGTKNFPKRSEKALPLPEILHLSPLTIEMHQSFISPLSNTTPPPPLHQARRKVGDSHRMSGGWYMHFKEEFSAHRNIFEHISKLTIEFSSLFKILFQQDHFDQGRNQRISSYTYRDFFCNFGKGP